MNRTIKLTDREKRQILSKETVIEWDPDYVFRDGERTVISADSFEKWAAGVVPQITDIKPVSAYIKLSSLTETGSDNMVWLGRKELLFIRKKPDVGACE